MTNLPQPSLRGPTLQQGFPRLISSHTTRLCFANPVRKAELGLSGLRHLRNSAGVGQGVQCHAARTAAAAVKPCCQAAAAAVATAVTAPVAATLPAPIIYTVLASTTYTAVCFIAMTLFPRKTSKFFTSIWPFIPLCLAYLALLAYSWTPDTLSIMMPGSLQEGLSGGFKPQFIPQLSGISALFSRIEVTASWVLHVLVINLFAGRWCLLEGLRQNIPTAHSVLLCSVFGPLGLLSHYFTSALTHVFPGLKAEEQTVTIKSEQGSITILPYTEAQ